MDIEKELEKLNVPDKEKIDEIFRKVQHIDAKVNALLALVTISLSLKEPFSLEQAESIATEQIERSSLSRLQNLIQKWG